MADILEVDDLGTSSWRIEQEYYAERIQQVFRFRGHEETS